MSHTHTKSSNRLGEKHKQKQQIIGVDRLHANRKVNDRGNRFFHTALVSIHHCANVLDRCDKIL